MTNKIQMDGKKIISLFLTLAMLLTMVPSIGLSTFADEAETLKLQAGTNQYIDKYGKIKPIPSSVTEIISSTINIGTGSASPNMWYIVTNTITNDNRIEVNGTANMILTDGCYLEAPKGIHVGKGNTLNIFAQSTGNNTGKLKAGQSCSFSGNAGIGGNVDEQGHGEDCGTVGIYGGDITAWSYGGAGIGGSSESNQLSTKPGGSGGKITIQNATINASSNFGAGIGGGSGSRTNAVKGGSGGKIAMINASVTAISNIGAGIGGGSGLSNSESGKGGDGGTLNIITSTITAQSTYAATIGGGCGNVDDIDQGNPTNVILNRTLTGQMPFVKEFDGTPILKTNNSWGKTLNSTKEVIIGYPVSYLDAHQRKLLRSDYIVVNSLTATTVFDFTNKAHSTPKWYVVMGDISAYISGEFGEDIKYIINDRIEVNGTANMILTDGCYLEAPKGIHVGKGNTLNIFAQSTGNNTGKLDVGQYDDLGNAGIGGNEYNRGENCGVVNIYGGNITARSRLGAGIGGGFGRSFDVTAPGGNGGHITIMNSTVNASSYDGAGIGGAAGMTTGGNGGSLKIINAHVMASSTDGAGIGGGFGNKNIGGNGGSIKLINSKIEALSEYGAGIGGGFGGSFFGYAPGGNGGVIETIDSKITVSSEHGAGIGGGYGTYKGGNGGLLKITSGIIQASSTEGVSIGGVNGGNKALISLRRCAVVRKTKYSNNITLRLLQTWGSVAQQNKKLYINANEHQWVKHRLLLLHWETCKICGAIR